MTAYNQKLSKCQKKYRLLLLFIFSLPILDNCAVKIPSKTISGVTFLNNKNSIVFSAFCEDRGAIYKTNNKGGIEKIHISNTYSNANPIIFSNKNRILFESYMTKASCPDLCVIDIDGTNQHCITKNGYGGEWVTLSIDKKKIFFMSACDNGNKTKKERMQKKLPPLPNVYSIDEDGNNRKKVTNFYNYRIANLSLSNDGKQLLMFRIPMIGNHSSTLWLYHLYEKKMVEFIPNLTNTTVYGGKEHTSLKWFSHPLFLPFNKSFMFIWKGEVYSTNQLTKKTKKMEIFPRNVYFVTFSPNENRVAFVEKEHIFTMNVDGSHIMEIASAKEACNL